MTVLSGHSVMAGPVPAISSGAVSRRMAGTGPAMTIGVSVWPRKFA
jgi:hypothetical protein